MRGDGAGEDVDGDCPPLDERSVGDDDGDDFPPPGGKCPRQNSSARALDWFRLVAAVFRPESFLLIFLG